MLIHKKEFKKAFEISIPVMMGYSVLGFVLDYWLQAFTTLGI